MTGIDSKNEKRAEAWRFIPSINAAVIVIPERDVPGIKAIACAQPMIATSLHLISSKIRVRLPLASDHQSNRPKPMVVAAMTKVERRLASIKSFANKPTRPAGIVPSNTPQASFASFLISTG